MGSGFQEPQTLARTLGACMPSPGLAWPVLLSPIPGSEELEPMTPEARSSSCSWISTMRLIPALILSSTARHPGTGQTPETLRMPRRTLHHWRAQHCKPLSPASPAWPALPPSQRCLGTLSLWG